MDKAKFKEMDPNRIRDILEGHEDTLTPKAKAIVKAKKSYTCRSCGATVSKFRIDTDDPFREDGLPNYIGVCEFCEFEEVLDVPESDS